LPEPSVAEGARGCPLSREQCEVDAFARNRIDEARGVADEEPAGTGRFEGFKIAERQGRNRPGVRLESRALGDPGSDNPVGRDLS
jgi:hypothetical protein